nr:heme transporter HRG1 isoform X1 [Globicephala melas]
MAPSRLQLGLRAAYSGLSSVAGFSIFLVWTVVYRQPGTAAMGGARSPGAPGLARPPSTLGPVTASSLHARGSRHLLRATRCEDPAVFTHTHTCAGGSAPLPWGLGEGREEISLMCGLVKGSQILLAAFAFTSSSYHRPRGLQQTPLYRESEKANTTVIMRRAWPGGPAGLWGVGR